MSSRSLRTFQQLVTLPDRAIPLAEAALLMACEEYPQLEISPYLDRLDEIANAARPHIQTGDNPLDTAARINEVLFDQLGFQGNSDEYYDPRNSFLNEVLTRRLGIPITLSLVYIDVGRRLGFPLVGIGLPGHFVVKHQGVDNLYIDPFHGGILRSREECAELVRSLDNADIQVDPRYFLPISNREFIARILRNLKSTYLEKEDHKRALRVMDFLLALLPRAPRELRDRGLVYYQLGSYSEALADLTGYVTSGTIGEDGQAVQEIMGKIMRRLGN